MTPKDIKGFGDWKSLALDATETVTITDHKRAEIAILFDQVIGEACRNIEDWDRSRTLWLMRRLWHILRR